MHMVFKDPNMRKPPSPPGSALWPPIGALLCGPRSWRSQQVLQCPLRRLSLAPGDVGPAFTPRVALL